MSFFLTVFFGSRLSVFIAVHSFLCFLLPWIWKVLRWSSRGVDFIGGFAHTHAHRRPATFSRGVCPPQTLMVLVFPDFHDAQTQTATSRLFMLRFSLIRWWLYKSLHMFIPLRNETHCTINCITNILLFSYYWYLNIYIYVYMLESRDYTCNIHNSVYNGNHLSVFLRCFCLKNTVLINAKKLL